MKARQPNAVPGSAGIGLGAEMAGIVSAAERTASGVGRTDVAIGLGAVDIEFGGMEAGCAEKMVTVVGMGCVPESGAVISATSAAPIAASAGARAAAVPPVADAVSDARASVALSVAAAVPVSFAHLAFVVPTPSVAQAFAAALSVAAGFAFAVPSFAAARVVAAGTAAAGSAVAIVGVSAEATAVVTAAGPVAVDSW